MRHHCPVLLLLAILCCLAASVDADTYAAVWGQEDLLRALSLAVASPLGASVIELPRDIALEPSAAAAYQLPLRVRGRLTLRRTQDAEAVTLDVGGIPQLLFLERGALLELSNLTLTGVAAADAPLAGPTQAKALVLYPAVDGEAGATVKLDAVALALPASQQCSAHAAGQPLGAATVLDGADGAAVGEVLVDATDVRVTCEGSTAGVPTSAPAPTPGSSSESNSGGGGGGGTPGWVWAVVAVAAVAGSGAVAAGVLMWRRRRAVATAAVASRAAGGSSLESSSSSTEIDKKLSTGNVSIAVFTPRS